MESAAEGADRRAVAAVEEVEDRAPACAAASVPDAASRRRRAWGLRDIGPWPWRTVGSPWELL